ncbi:hypothetical protein H0H81_007366 [Sphagnurus paluster]|uniref:SET domain-containing protein n=1 Tax=Sphagnurus paluster TaxID=117069 RepID=A0A9P7FWM4_9AGAR|nr:hypothetical protein H0H81_007366 [Sphagnurus paluster]
MGAVNVANGAAVVSRVFTGNDGGWSRVAETPERTAWWGLRKRSSVGQAANGIAGGSQEIVSSLPTQIKSAPVASRPAMKHGFLNNKNKKPKPSGTASPESTAELVGPVVIPSTPKPPEPAPRAGDFSREALTFSMGPLPRDNSAGPTALCLLYVCTGDALTPPGFPGAIPSAAMSSKQPYNTEFPIPGMGKGVVANVAFAPGDDVMCERPLLIYPAAFPYIEGVTPHPEVLIKRMVDNLPPSSQELFYGLHNCKNNTPKDIQGIIETNGLNVGAMPGRYEGVYAAVCTPNACHMWDLHSLAFYVRALRPISEGEQICISYLGTVFEPRAARQEELWSKYSFRCSCACCILPNAESARSNVRLTMLADAEEREINKGSEDTILKSWAADVSLPDNHIYRNIQIILGFMDEEGAYSSHLWLSHSEIMCKALCALEDREGAVEVARRAAVMSKAFTGKDGGWARVAETPEKTEWWGLRKRQMIGGKSER